MGGGGGGGGGGECKISIKRPTSLSIILKENKNVQYSTVQCLSNSHLQKRLSGKTQCIYK